MVSNRKDTYKVVTYNIKKTHLDGIEFLPGDKHIVPVAEKSSVLPLSAIDILHEEFTNFKTFICQELNFMKQELSDVKQNTNASDRRNCNYETYHKNGPDQKIVLLESNSTFLLQELHNKQIIIEKLLNNISSNSDKMKVVKHLSENQKQKVENYWKPSNKSSKKLNHHKR